MRDTQSRKWQITINNPIEKGFTHDEIKKRLVEFKGLVYWCMSDEVGESGTFHTHLFIASGSGIRFSTVKSKFDGAHFEMARGTCQQNRDYVFKEGKWLDDKKGETNIRDSHEEMGDIPVERQGQRNDLIDLYDMIKSGKSDYEIIEENPEYMGILDKIGRVRQIIKEEKYKHEFRKLKVEYIWGETGIGKTRGVMEKYGYENVYRITDYEHMWDGYKQQDVVIFEEFRSQVRISDMLNYLDGYPLTLPCRYYNKVACYTKVYILSNLSLSEQYEEIQFKYPQTWQAFLRRIHSVIKKENYQMKIDDVPF